MDAITLILAIITFVFWVYLLINPRRYDGRLVVRTNEEGVSIFTLQLNCGPEELMHKKSISFKVDSSDEEMKDA